MPFLHEAKGSRPTFRLDFNWNPSGKHIGSIWPRTLPQGVIFDVPAKLLVSSHMSDRVDFDVLDKLFVRAMETSLTYIERLRRRL